MVDGMWVGFERPRIQRIGFHVASVKILCRSRLSHDCVIDSSLRPRICPNSRTSLRIFVRVTAKSRRRNTERECRAVRAFLSGGKRSV